MYMYNTRVNKNTCVYIHIITYTYIYMHNIQIYTIFTYTCLLKNGDIAMFIYCEVGCRFILLFWDDPY